MGIILLNLVMTSAYLIYILFVFINRDNKKKVLYLDINKEELFKDKKLLKIYLISNIIIISFSFLLTGIVIMKNLIPEYILLVVIILQGWIMGINWYIKNKIINRK